MRKWSRGFLASLEVQTLHCMVLPAVPGTKNIKNHRTFIDFAMEVPEVAAVLHNLKRLGLFLQDVSAACSAHVEW